MQTIRRMSKSEGAAMHFYIRSRIASVIICYNSSMCLSNSFVAKQSTLTCASSCVPNLYAKVVVSSSRPMWNITRSMKLILGVPHSGLGLSRPFRLLLRARVLISGFAVPPLALHGMAVMLTQCRPTLHLLKAMVSKSKTVCGTGYSVSS